MILQARYEVHALAPLFVAQPPSHGFPLRRHELPVGSSALPYDECTNTLQSYVTTDLFGGTIDSVRNIPQHADPSASAPASSASSTSPTASICLHFASNFTPYIGIPKAPKSYWPTSPPAVAPAATPTEHPQSTSTPIRPSQLPANTSPPTAVPTPTAPAAPTGQPQALPPSTSQDTTATAPTSTGTTDTTQTQAHTSTNATSLPAAATPATPSQDTTASRPTPINITVPTPHPPPTQPSLAVPTPPQPKATVRQRSTTTTTTTPRSLAASGPKQRPVTRPQPPANPPTKRGIWAPPPLTSYNTRARSRSPHRSNIRLTPNPQHSDATASASTPDSANTPRPKGLHVATSTRTEAAEPH